MPSTVVVAEADHDSEHDALESPLLVRALKHDSASWEKAEKAGRKAER